MLPSNPAYRSVQVYKNTVNRNSDKTEQSAKKYQRPKCANIAFIHCIVEIFNDSITMQNKF